MGNNDPREPRNFEESQQVHPQQTTGQPARVVGLTPTNGQDAYKRSATRSSRRSRPERASYLMATGHLDIEETQQLNKPSPSSNNYVGGYNYDQEQHKLTSHDSPTSKGTPNGQQQPSKASGDQAYLKYVSSDQLNNDINIFSHNNFKASVNSNKSRSSSRSNNNNRGKFRQTYTEVTLPMKTSPAFEYILKDNKRRNKRCCWLLLYLILVTILIAILVFSCTHAALRFNNY